MTYMVLNHDMIYIAGEVPQACDYMVVVSVQTDCIQRLHTYDGTNEPSPLKQEAGLKVRAGLGILVRRIQRYLGRRRG